MKKPGLGKGQVLQVWPEAPAGLGERLCCTARTGLQMHGAPCPDDADWLPRLSQLLWTQETCNPMPNFESTWNPIGSGIKFDPLVPDAPVLKAPEPMWVPRGLGATLVRK